MRIGRGDGVVRVVWLSWWLGWWRGHEQFTQGPFQLVLTDLRPSSHARGHKGGLTTTYIGRGFMAHELLPPTLHLSFYMYVCFALPFVFVFLFFYYCFIRGHCVKKKYTRFLYTG